MAPPKTEQCKECGIFVSRQQMKYNFGMALKYIREVEAVRRMMPLCKTCISKSFAGKSGNYRDTL